MSVNSLQGVRGLMHLSHEKREDGLTTPTHSSVSRTRFRGSSGSPGESAAAHGESSDSETERELQLTTTGAGAPDNMQSSSVSPTSDSKSTPAAPAAAAAAAAAAALGLDATLSNPNKHLSVADLLPGGLAFSDPFTNIGLGATDSETGVVVVSGTSMAAEDQPNLPQPLRGEGVTGNMEPPTDSDSPSSSSSSSSSTLAAMTNLTSEVDDAIASTQQWRQEQEAKLQAQLCEMKRAHRRQIQAQQAALLTADLAQFDVTVQDDVEEDDGGDGGDDGDREGEGEGAPPANRPEQEDSNNNSMHLNDSSGGQADPLEQELYRLRLRAQNLREDSAGWDQPAHAAADPLHMGRLLRDGHLEQQLLDGDRLVSSTGQVYSQSVEDRMERLGMAARVAQLQMSATEDDQVRQRQDAALEDALEYADSADGVTKLEDQLGDFGTALSDILSKLDSLEGGASASAETKREGGEGGGGAASASTGAPSTAVVLTESVASVRSARRADDHSHDDALESDETRTAAATAELED